MLRLVLVALLTSGLAACGTAPAPVEPPADTERLREFARKPVVAIDPADAPKPPKGFTRAEVRRLATWLADAAGRIDGLTGTADVDHRTAADSTFSALDMRSRVEFSRLMDRVSHETREMPMAWAVTDRFEVGSRPVGPARVVKAAWAVDTEAGWLEVSLQVVRAHLSADGEPMFVDRTFILSSTGLTPGPVSIAVAASVSGIDRCHVIETGLFRPERDPEQLERSAASMERELASDDVTPTSNTDFTAGCD